MRLKLHVVDATDVERGVQGPNVGSPIDAQSATGRPTTDIYSRLCSCHSSPTIGACGLILRHVWRPQWFHESGDILVPGNWVFGYGVWEGGFPAVLIRPYNADSIFKPGIVNGSEWESGVLVRSQMRLCLLTA